MLGGRGVRDAVGVFLPDLRLIGLRQGMAALELATAFGVHASLHNSVGPVLDAISRQVSAAIPSFFILERQVDESPLYDAIRGSAAEVRDGSVAVEMLSGPDSKVLSQVSMPGIANTGAFATLARAGPDVGSR